MLQLCVYRDIEHAGSLESTQEARVQEAQLLRLSCALQTSRVLSISTHELIVNFPWEIFLEALTSLCWLRSKWNWKLNEGENSTFTWWKVSFVQVLLFCEEKFTWLLYINLSYKVSFPRRPFRRHESRTLLLGTTTITRKFTSEVRLMHF